MARCPKRIPGETELPVSRTCGMRRLKEENGWLGGVNTVGEEKRKRDVRRKAKEKKKKKEQKTE
jgi:hypothetical protein